MNKRIDAIKIIGLAGMALGGLASLIGSWAQEKTMERTIEEKVQKAIAEQNKEEESE